MSKEQDKSKNFEEMVDELEQIVNELENGDAPLEVAIKKYTDAMKIANLCNAKLKKAEKEITKILAENDELKDFENEE